MIRDLIEGGSVIEIINVIVAVLMIAATILCFVYLIWAGLQYILAAGSDEKVQAATGTLRYSIIGLLTVFVAFFIVQFLTALFDLPFDISYDRITATMTEIMGSF